MNNRIVQYATAQMLIRSPATKVFNAFIDPEITKNFWFTKGSGKMETGKEITWAWEMYGFSTTAIAKEIIPDKKIVFDWSSPLRTVTMEFTEIKNKSTYVTITEEGNEVTENKLLAAVRDSTGGFTTVLDGLKAYLEHGINLNLIVDKFPQEMQTQHAE